MGVVRAELVQAYEWLASALFPTPCASCAGLGRATDPPLCAPCWARLPRFQGERCLCGRAASSPRCARCLAQTPAFDEVFSLGPFESPLRDAVHALKYGGRHRSARGLARRIVERAPGGLFEGVDALVAVPLGSNRERERGFNQASLLAQALAELSGKRAVDGLRRIRETAPQTGLGAEARAANVRGAFAASGRFAGTYLLVDDVATTGATLEACASALKSAGARVVRAVTVARAE